jgi:hypothetical protein
MQIDNGSTPLVGIGNCRIERIAPLGHGWLRSICQYPLNGVVGELATKTHKTNGRNFMQTKTWIFSSEIDYQLTYLWWETPACLSRRALFAKQADHAILLKLAGLVVQCPFTGSSLFCPFCCRFSKKDNRSQTLIDLLLRPERLLLNLLPIVGSFSALARRHNDHLFAMFFFSLLIGQFVLTRVTPMALAGRAK